MFSGEQKSIVVSELIKIEFLISTRVENNSNNIENFLNNTYPNPFNSFVNIAFNLSKSASVDIKIFDILGNEIQHFSLQNCNQGENIFKWDGKNQIGDNVPTGNYMLVAQSSGLILTKLIQKMK